jgi:hypothetical protein
VWPIATLLVLAITTGSACLLLSRTVMPMRTPWMLVLVGFNSLLLVVLGLIFSPLLIMPIFLIGSLAGVLQQPSTYPASIAVGAHLLPLLVLLVFESTGILPSTFTIGMNDLTFTLWVVDLTPTTTLLLFFLAFLTVSIHVAGVTLISKRAAEAAQDHQHAVAWHLRQMLPRADRREP